MANKGNSRHMKSLTASRYYSVHKKEQVYVTKPSCGRHTLDKSISLVSFAKKVGLAQTRSEASKMIKRKEVLVNGNAVKDIRYPIGLNDTVEIVPAKEGYRLGINERGQVSIDKADKKSFGERLCRIVQRYKTSNGIIMIRLHDGTVMKSGKDTNVNDSVIVDNAKTIKKVLKLAKGSRCLVVEGVHVGMSGTVKEIKPGTATAPSSVTVEQQNGGEFGTLLKNIMVVE